MERKLLVVLTQYKRSHLEKQLESVNKQTLKPDYVVVFQNGNYVDINPLKKKYDFLHVHSDYNTKFFGRFAYCFTFPVDICIVMDDDIIPGNNCFKNYVDECLRLNGIIGGNGRFGIKNPRKPELKRQYSGDVGVRTKSLEIDFVGHLWCFKKEWLYYMFSLQPYTYDTGEDMHFCFSSKILGGIKSYACKQTKKEDFSDIALNSLASDQFSTFKTIPKNIISTVKSLRAQVEIYFLEKYNLKMVGMK